MAVPRDPLHISPSDLDLDIGFASPILPLYDDNLAGAIKFLDILLKELTRPFADVALAPLDSGKSDDRSTGASTLM
ncbi:hypothetical protein EUX98_g8463 [Antrodiella citrinella]|uniref:Uncharacterized protein n=1 Tax=Antrodiella citrinella TaxID=2447956 RepID=A0A4S4M8H7_9APHY|nr:hypothetical protein EUX98_g8463 [Antrodiella citrinella]